MRKGVAGLPTGPPRGHFIRHNAPPPPFRRPTRGPAVPPVDTGGRRCRMRGPARRCRAGERRHWRGGRRAPRAGASSWGLSSDELERPDLRWRGAAPWGAVALSGERQLLRCHRRERAAGSFRRRSPKLRRDLRLQGDSTSVKPRRSGASAASPVSELVDASRPGATAAGPRPTSGVSLGRDSSDRSSAVSCHETCPGPGSGRTTHNATHPCRTS